MNYSKADNFEAYNIASNLSNEVWDIVIQWPYLSQKTIGAQFIDIIKNELDKLPKAINTLIKYTNLQLKEKTIQPLTIKQFNHLTI